MSTLKATNFQHPSAGAPAIVLDSAGGATVAGMGLVAVVPTSIANSGGTATLLDNTITFTGVTSVSLNSCFTTTFTNYRIIVSETNSTNSDLNMRFRVSGTDNTTTNYKWAYTGTSFLSPAAVNSGGTAVNLMRISASAGSLFRISSNIDVMQPQETERTTLSGSYCGEAHGGAVAGRFDATTAFDGFTLFVNAGTITGTVAVYGYKK